MENIEFYDITGKNQNLNWKILPIDVFFDDKNVLKKWVDRYSGFHSLNKWTAQELIKVLFDSIGIEVDKTFLKDVWPISFQIRQNIKNTDKALLELLDSPDFLIPYTYLLSWFAVGKNTKESKDGVNTIEDLSCVIRKILSLKYVESFSFFCAHRENKEIAKNKLVEKINLDALYKVNNLVKWILANTSSIDDYNVVFCNMDWCSESVVSIFPNLFIEYFSKWKLYILSDLLDSQFQQISENIWEKNKIESATKYYKETSIYLESFYWSDWKNITLKSLQGMSDDDPLAKIALNNTLPNLDRFNVAFDNFVQKNSQISIKNFMDINIKSAREKWKEEIVWKAMEMFFNKSNIIAKALYETAFYYLRWKKIRDGNDIGLWFDRDHDLHQTKAFKLGYGDESAPLIYARRTWKKSWTLVNDISFRQFWHY
jgi:hypothetical protein